ncbi:MAG TPA: hypothetical protein PLY87_00815 [Planctomycetaceae bacterium]|nr:hypothetical protein [Planctomycetaceae bacterium]HQZ63576.1 hypothetical protein [Planctomycetaceae bacterium]HRA87623.1 hypothetical protein [Planctomycetaceae bacterium]
MTDHLSEVIEDWPLSPFEVLGVPRTADKTEVRRAYSALIRRFRPETHPRHFQRVRESYEAVLTIVQSRDSQDGRLPAELRIDLSPLIRTPGVPRESIRETRNVESQESSDSTAAELLWLEFSQRPQRSQFDGIRNLLQGSSANATTLLIGFWMLKLCPEFAPLEQPAYWLMRGIKEYPLDSRFVDLLLIELQRHPELTMSGVSGRVAETFRNSELLLIYLHGRWTMLGQRRRWLQLREEISELRPKIALEFSAAWFGLIMRCFRATMFLRDSDVSELQREIRSEIESIGAHHREFSAAMDEMDLLLAAQDTLDDQSESTELDNILRECLVQNDHELRHRLFEFTEEWIESPDVGLRRLTNLSSRHPELIWLLMSRMSGLEAFNDLSRQLHPDLPDAVRDLLSECTTIGYHVARYATAQFCHQHAISGMDLLAQLMSLTECLPSAQMLSETIRSDAPLMITCQLVGNFLRAI